MGLREILNRNPAAAAVIAIIVVGAALAMVFSRSSDRPVQNQAWFYDLKTGALFAADRFATPPIAAPSGAGNGVTAVVLGCGSCPAAPTQATWIEMMTPEALEAKRQMDAAANSPTDNPIIVSDEVQQAFMKGQMLALPIGPGQTPQWIAAESSEGQALKKRLTTETCTGSGKPQICLP